MDIIKASIKGDKDKNTPNQDFIKVYENDYLLLVAVSDGLGSSKYSLDGAKEACKIVAREIKKIKNIELISSLSSSISAEWNRSIASKPGEIKDYRTTNSFVAVMKNLNTIIIGQIGDVFVSIRVDGIFKHIDVNEKDFLNETDCLGSGRQENYKISVVDFSHSYDFLLATDGIGDEFLEDKIEALHNYLLSKYRNLTASRRNGILKKEIAQFLNEKNNDDKSLAFVWTNKK